MALQIETISLNLSYNLGTVNCYLIITNTSFILIDTGYANKRAELEKKLESKGCKPGKLKLIIITHGDFDHTGNAAFLREKYGAKIAIHRNESGVVEKGDMFLGRKRINGIQKIFARIFLPLLRLGKFEKFKPDIYLHDGYDLSEYGLDAAVLHIKGHSNGSIGINTRDGDLFCGDLFQKNGKQIIDDPAEYNTSVEKLKSLQINTVYPGHGNPFPMKNLTMQENN